MPRSHRMMSLLLLALALPAQAGESTMLSRKDVNYDGNVELILENRFVRVVLDPSVGGMIRSYVDKPTGLELVYPSTKEIGGWFNDYLIDRKHDDEYATTEYEATVEADESDLVQVRLVGHGQSKKTAWLRIAKTCRLAADSPLLRVNYTITNREGSMTPMDFGYRFRHRVGTPEMPAAIYRPLSEGVRQVDCGDVYPVKWQLDHDPAAGWAAYLTDDGPGVVFTLAEYPRLMATYLWTRPSLHTLEWMTYPVNLASGDSTEFHFTVFPVRNLPRVDGAADNLAGAIVFDSDAGETPGQVAGRVLLESADSTPPQPQATARCVDPEPTEPLDVPVADDGSFRFVASKPGTWVLAVRAGDLRFERPLAVGIKTIRYRAQPIAKRIGPDDLTYEKLLNARDAQAKAPAMKTLDLSVEDPHVNWARPYAQGRPRVLFLADSSESVGREVVELAQAFDIELDWVHMVKSHWKNPTYECQVKWKEEYSQHYLKQKLSRNDYDAIVVAMNFPMKKHLTDEVLALLKKQWDSGTGLVWIAPDGEVLQGEYAKLPPCSGRTSANRPWQPGEEPHFLNRALPYAAYPIGRRIAGDEIHRGKPVVVSPYGKEGYGEKTIVLACEDGKTREVALNWNIASDKESIFTPNVSPYGKGNRFDDDFPKYRLKDYYYLLLGKAVLWAARHEPSLRIAEFHATPPQVVLTLDNPDPTFEARIKLNVRDRLGRIVQTFTKQVALKKGESSFQFDLTPPQLAGLHLVDLHVTRDGKAVQFGATTFDVPSPLPTVDLTLAEKTLPAGQPIRAEARLEKLFDNGIRATWQIVDPYDRILLSKTQDWPAGEKTLVFEEVCPSLSSRSATLWLILQPPGAPEIRLSRFFVHIPEPPERRLFEYTLDGYGEGTLRGPTFYRVLREAGFTSLQGSREDTDAVKVAEGFDVTLSSLIWRNVAVPGSKGKAIMARYNKTRKKSDLVRWENLDDPELKRKLDDYVRGVVKRGRDMGIHNVSYVDEFRYGERGQDVCFSPEAMHAMRDWLKDKYGTLEKLNAVWQRGYSNWREVTPDLLSEARKRGVMTAWADHRAYNRYRYNQWIESHRRIAKEILPEVKLLVSGTFRCHPWAATGPWQQAKHFDGMDGYAFVFNRDAQRSFMPDGARVNLWLGYETDGQYAKNWFWEYVFNDATGVSFWHRQQCVRPDFTLSSGGKAIAPLVRLLQRGVYDLLRESDRQNSGMAMRYDPACWRGRQYSYHAANAFGNAEEHWSDAFKGVSASYDVLAGEQIEDGMLDKPGNPYSILLLPAPICISDEESEKLTDFVRSGGTIVVDHTVGLMEQNCAWRGRGVLDDLLGIAERKHDRPTPGKERIAVSDGGPLAGLTVPAPVEETGLVLTGDAEVLARAGDEPGIWRRDVGEGNVYCLNFAFSCRNNNEHHLNPLMRRLLDLLEAEELVAVQPGHPDTPTVYPEVVTYTMDDHIYLGHMISKDDTDPKTVPPGKLILPRPMYVYAVETRKPLGLCESITTDGLEHFYAALPQEITGVTLSMPGEVRAGEEVPLSLGVKTSADPGNQRHVLNVTVLGPDGKEIYTHMHNVVFRGRAGTTSFRTALNAPEKLTVVVTEPITGQSVRGTLRVTGQINDPHDSPIQEARR